MSIVELQGWIMIGLELTVVGYLHAEYFYDKRRNERIKHWNQERAKRKAMEAENITTGEGR